MYGYKNQIVREQVDLSSPSLKRLRVALFEKFGIEEGGESVASFEVGLFASLAYQVHVEVDDLVVEPVEAA